MVLGLNDLRKVLDELYTICSKWYYIGLRLDVPAEMLEKIEADTEANDHHSCLRKVIVDWLKTGKATWLALCQALRHFTIDQAKLADTIQAKYQIVRTTSKSQSGSSASASTGASAITSERSSSTNLTPSQDRQSAEGNSKSQEKPKGASQVAAKIGKSDTNKAKKRPSDTPGPSSVKKPKLSVKLPDSLAIDDFATKPPADYLCIKCYRVPLNPQRSVCCKRLYCEPCSKKNKRCRAHKVDLQYTDDKDLYGKIQKLNITSCPNRKGCDWEGGEVFNLKKHIPTCGGCTKGKDVVTPSQRRISTDKGSKTGSKLTESRQSVPTTNNQIQINSYFIEVRGNKEKQDLVQGSSSAATVGKVTESPEGTKAMSNADSTKQVSESSLAEKKRESNTTSAYRCSCLPLNMVMKPVSKYQESRGKVWLSPIFLSHQLGYKLRLAVKVQPPPSIPLNASENLPLDLEVGIVSAPGAQAGYLEVPCVVDITILILNPQQNQDHEEISGTFLIGEETNIKFSFASVPKEYVFNDHLFFRIVKVELSADNTMSSRLWLLNPHLDVN